MELSLKWGIFQQIIRFRLGFSIKKTHHKSLARHDLNASLLLRLRQLEERRWSQDAATWPLDDLMNRYEL
jgi:hypothetical protein